LTEKGVIGAWLLLVTLSNPAQLVVTWHNSNRCG
jgi:hypothetical protein